MTGAIDRGPDDDLDRVPNAGIIGGSRDGARENRIYNRECAAAEAGNCESRVTRMRPEDAPSDDSNQDRFHAGDSLDGESLFFSLLVALLLLLLVTLATEDEQLKVPDEGGTKEDRHHEPCPRRA